MAALLLGLLAGCGSSESEETASPAEAPVLPTTDTDESFPNLASVPAEPPVSTPRIDRDKLVQQLQADRANAAYIGEALSAESVTLPPAAAPPSQAPESLALPTEDSPEDEIVLEEDVEDVVSIEPPAALPTDIGQMAALIYFDGGSTAMTDHDRAILYDVARLQGKSRGGHLRLVGHANASEAGGTEGVEIVGLDLALARANAVADTLIDYGVPASFLETSTAPGSTTFDASQPNGEAANRRVEIYLAQ
jgi:outer membrane protein OmpA-like peptidoglycan-associated protein